jgi:8-oxo-dGTP pyrophosphatase MutT (NUDIX family)
MIFRIDDIKFSLRFFQHKEKYPRSDGRTVQSAVLIPLISRIGDLTLVYTRRAGNLARHAGQVSFPGGVREPGDQTPVDTALRETREEIGLPAGSIEVIGQLPPYNSSTGFCVYPVVGFIKEVNGLRNNFEVEKLFFVPLVWLDDPANSYRSDYASADGKEQKLWYFTDYDGETIWGLTAQVTKDFLALIKKER